MILKGFKEKSNKKYINSILKNRVINVDEKIVESIIVLFYIDAKSNVKAYESLINKLNKTFNKVEVLAFSDTIKDVDSLSIKTFNQSAIGWKGKIKDETLASIINSSYDASVNYFISESVYLSLLATKVQAPIKIGIGKEEQAINDITINTKVEEYLAFNTELIKYLQVLKKI